MKKSVVITSIASQESSQIRNLLEQVRVIGTNLIVVADLKTPNWSPEDSLYFLSIEEQLDKWPSLANLLPFNHYSRKNLGYLLAKELGTETILDTDDDNCPIGDPWEWQLQNCRRSTHSGWTNVYQYFGMKHLWPRGFPLEFAYEDDRNQVDIASITTREIACFQSLVDGDPDIDAIGRLLFPNQMEFSPESPLILGSAGVCPTNSQATIWADWTIPLLYLPSNVSFRMTDIWRGLILQPCFTKLNARTVFGKLGFRQERNLHDLKRDFELEVSGHLNSEKVYETAKSSWEEWKPRFEPQFLLEGLSSVYRELEIQGIVPSDELVILNEWITSFSQIH